MKTLNEVFKDFFEYNKPLWSNRTRLYKKQAYRDHVKPYLGKMKVNEIKPIDILKVLKILEDEGKTKTTKFVLQILRKCFHLAVASAYCDFNPATSLTDALKPHQTKNHPFISESRMPFLFKALKEDGRLDLEFKVAFLLVTYTAVRVNEACKARWPEFNFKQERWSIPASRMKRRRPHVVPLPKQVIEILLMWKEKCPSNVLVFPELKDINKPMYSVRLINAINKTSYKGKQTVHGLRGRFSTSAYESELWRDDAIEMSLAHAVRGTKGIYNKATYFNERKKLMQWYANKVEKWTKGFLE
ncbi:tyrosine-type recombinase/integrase [Acinetobacter nosocomialis]|uniref:tyrosine-type recombinase/integrase n=1 Tax=Acinetobacter nosocomialis TaxID=106654 RepID=UPI002708E609|nr:tyrosine-type recombinase/integrase [Acinetobacter nosocomialis]MDO7194592.1 tyrosine-type recombinase/integrase [Acinetobacter nosocomialis]